MVASDTVQRICSLLLEHGFKVAVKEFREKSIYGEELYGSVVRGFKEKPSVILLTRKCHGKNLYRVRVFIPSATQELSDSIEALGYRVSEEGGVVAVGYFDESSVIEKISQLLSLIASKR